LFLLTRGETEGGRAINNFARQYHDGTRSTQSSVIAQLNLPPARLHEIFTGDAPGTA